MSLVNLTKVASVAKTATQPEVGYTKDGGVEAYKIFFNSGSPSFRISARRSAYPGRKGNFLSVGVFFQATVRYLITLFERDTDKLDGTVSTQSEGGNKLTSDGIVSKINSSALGEFIKAELITSEANVNYTGAANVVFADALPLKGGRSRGR